MHHRRAWLVTKTLLGYLNSYFLLSPKSKTDYDRFMGSGR